jgi:hypothetical protein
MLDLTNYLIANPLVAVGLGILALLVLHNLRRGQPRIAVSMVMLICVTGFYIFRQMVVDAEAEAVLWEQTSEAIAAPPALLEAPE